MTDRPEDRVEAAGAPRCPVHLAVPFGDLWGLGRGPSELSLRDPGGGERVKVGNSVGDRLGPDRGQLGA